jgi:hypothetical protein
MQRVAIKPSDLSFRDDDFCPDEFSGFRDEDVESTKDASKESAKTTETADTALVFVADRGLLQSLNAVEFSKSQETWNGLVKASAYISEPSEDISERLAAFGSSSLSRVPELVYHINHTAHGFVMPLHWSSIEKSSKMGSAMGRFSASQPMLSFFKKALQTAVIVAARVFVGFDRIVVPGILDDSASTVSIQMGSMAEGISGRMGPFKTSPKPLCEKGLLAPSEGLASMTDPIHAVGLRLSHSDIFVPFEKTSDPAVMSKCFQAIA